MRTSSHSQCILRFDEIQRLINATSLLREAFQVSSDGRAPRDSGSRGCPRDLLGSGACARSPSRSGRTPSRLRRTLSRSRRSMGRQNRPSRSRKTSSRRFPGHGSTRTVPFSVRTKCFAVEKDLFAVRKESFSVETFLLGRARTPPGRDEVHARREILLLGWDGVLRGRDDARRDIGGVRDIPAGFGSGSSPVCSPRDMIGARRPRTQTSLAVVPACRIDFPAALDEIDSGREPRHPSVNRLETGLHWKK